MKSLTDVSAPIGWRAPPPVASPWGRRPASLWAIVLDAWRESMDVYARTAGVRLPWGPFF